MSPATRTASGPDGVSIELPGGLREDPEVTSDGVALAAVAEPWPWPEAFRPRLVLETRPLAPDTATVPQLSSQLIANLIARGLHVAACDVWPAPGVENGRRIISLFAAMDNTIIRTQYVAIRGGRAVLLTLEYGAGNHRSGAAIFRDVVASLRCDAEEPVPEPDQQAMPRLDPVGREKGLELEDLTRIHAAQPYASAGPPMPEEQIDALRGGKLRRVDTAALEARGFVGGRGRLTDVGEAVHRGLDAPARRVTAEVVTDGESRVARLEILQRQPASVVLADPPPGAPTGGRTLDLIATDTTAIALARWVGLAPAWMFGIADDEVATIRLEGAVLDARLTSPGTPAPEATADGLLRMWAQPWHLITLRADLPVDRVVRVIATPDDGYFRLERDEGTREALLTLLPAAHFLLELLWYGGFDLTKG